MECCFWMGIFFVILSVLYGITYLLSHYFGSKIRVNFFHGVIVPSMIAGSLAFFAFSVEYRGIVGVVGSVIIILSIILLSYMLKKYKNK